MRLWCVEHLDPEGTTVGMKMLREKEQAKEQVRKWHTPTVDGHTAKLTYRTPTPEERERWSSDPRVTFDRLLRDVAQQYNMSSITMADYERAYRQAQARSEPDPTYREVRARHEERLREIESMLYPPQHIRIEVEEPLRRTRWFRRRRREV